MTLILKTMRYYIILLTFFLFVFSANAQQLRLHQYGDTARLQLFDLAGSLIMEGPPLMIIKKKEREKKITYHLEALDGAFTQKIETTLRGAVSVPNAKLLLFSKKTEATLYISQYKRAVLYERAYSFMKKGENFSFTINGRKLKGKAKRVRTLGTGGVTYEVTEIRVL